MQLKFLWDRDRQVAKDSMKYYVSTYTVKIEENCSWV